MKRLLTALLMLVFIMGTTSYCQSAEKAAPQKAPKANIEQINKSQTDEGKTTTSIQVDEDKPEVDEPYEEQEEEF